MPVIVRQSERVEQPDPRTVRIRKPKGVLMVSTDAGDAFELVPADRTFNLVPGFEAVPLVVAMQPGKEVRVRIETTD
jgi:hypothetical protein